MATSTDQNTKNTSACDYDIVIIGGGLVGACLAKALSDQPMNIAIIEAVDYKSNSQPSFDDRAIALSHGSKTILAGIGVWHKIENSVTAINDIHISEQGRFGITRLNARQENVNALGYVTTAREIGQAIISDLPQQKNVDRFIPASLIALDITDDRVTLVVNETGSSREITAKLVIAADGGQSSVRELLNISADKKDYQQHAVVTNISTERPHNNTAYERFTRHGPMALLPMSGNQQPNNKESNHRMSVVWTQHQKNVESILDLSDIEFLHQLQQVLGPRLGAFTKVGKRTSYPLQLVRAREQIKNRLVLIGNAAHTLHPVAGQGFNLGIRDVAVLAQLLVDASMAGEDVGEQKLLADYVDWRSLDHRKIINFTHGLVSVFSNDIRPLALMRNLGLLTTDLISPLKRNLAKTTMGMAGRLPRLARGLPIGMSNNNVANSQ